jgi:branched-subunit amino acid ABC-type transport system permease component
MPSTYAVGLGLIIIIIGVPFLAFGMLVQLGRYKKWYLHEGDPLYNPKEFAYVCIPSGLMFIFMGTALLLPMYGMRQAVFWGLAFPLCVAVMVLLFWLPDWIKPAWVRWLEKEHGDILLLLLRQARRTPDWEQRVATQEGLEAWVAEVRDKYLLKPGEPAKAIKV